MYLLLWHYKRENPRDHYNIDVPYSSNIVGTSLGKAVFNCVRVIRPTI